MPDLITLTINPAVDVSTSVNRVKPVHKLRCSPEQRDPGGGGINVARVAKRFDADVVAVYPVGGPIGNVLDRLLDQEGVRHRSIPIAGDTREDFTVLETDTGEQFRFVVPGPRLGEAEWRACLDALAALARPRMVVASGSLPPGVPEDFYGLVAQAARSVGARFVVDTSGPPLRRALEAGCYLVKPSLNEMRELVGEPLDREHDCVMAARRLVDAGRAEVVALTLGHYGALLIAHDRVLRAGALPIRAVSTVGAGDSFLGAMLVRLAGGHNLDDAFRYGVAAGSAALLAPGTDLCRRDDVERLIGDVKVHRLTG
ncbi:MAG: 1-phosphofructokinase family hexose kinase [Hyphomicrobiales bacterium]|nr:1-phosphofructokinase family hexose kinase [Hyphomicrobiales bacterium]